MTDGVDVVVTLHALATYAENANHWTDDKRMMDASGVADTIYEAMDRIEALEAKLARAVEVLDEAHTSMMNNCDAEAFRILDVALAELKGGTDE